MTTDLVIRDDQDFWTERQIAALRQLGVQNASNADLAVFFHQCSRTGLDPFARQVYMIGRWSKEGTKYTIQTGIDGFRLIGRRAVDRSGETLGMKDTEWCDRDGRWHDVWLSTEPPAAARVTILRNGQPFPAIAMFDEYKQTNKDGALSKMWADKPAGQIAKCAEALAWRKAFPQDLSGLYTSDEMDRSNGPDVHIPQPEVTATVDEQGEIHEAEVVEEELAPLPTEIGGIKAPTRRRMFALLGELNLTDDEQRDRMGVVLGRTVESRASLTEDEAQRICRALEARKEREKLAAAIVPDPEPALDDPTLDEGWGQA